MNKMIEGLQLLQTKHNYISVSLVKVPDKVQVINGGIFSLTHFDYVLHKDVHLLTVSYDENNHFHCNLIIPDDFTKEDVNKLLGRALMDSVQTAIRVEGISWKELSRDIQEIFGE